MPKITNQSALQAAMFWELKHVYFPTPLLMSKGVYKITNINNGRFYIGATDDCFMHRWRQHQCGLQNNHKLEYLAMTNIPMMLDFDKGNKDFYSLRFEILVNMPTSSAKEIFAEEARQILNLTPHYNQK
jgi:predicted GIY-YIG superfamily endonuclease